MSFGYDPSPPGEGEFVEESGDAVVAGGDAEAAGLVSEGAGQIGFSRPGRTADQHGLAVPDPLPGSEAEHEGAVVRGQFLVRRVQVRLVAAGLTDRSLLVVRIKSSGTPPQNSNILTCDIVQSGSDRLRVTSTKVWFEAPRTRTKTMAPCTSPVFRSTTSNFGPA